MRESTSQRVFSQWVEWSTRSNSRALGIEQSQPDGKAVAQLETLVCFGRFDPLTGHLIPEYPSEDQNNQKLGLVKTLDLLPHSEFGKSQSVGEDSQSISVMRGKEKPWKEFPSTSKSKCDFHQVPIP